jgi:hypothetical protein
MYIGLHHTYSTPTNGLDTPDLLQVRALLQELPSP